MKLSNIWELALKVVISIYTIIVLIYVIEEGYLMNQSEAGIVYWLNICLITLGLIFASAIVWYKETIGGILVIVLVLLFNIINATLIYAGESQFDFLFLAFLGFCMIVVQIWKSKEE